MEKIIFKTASVCPVCKERTDASYIQKEENIFLKKECNIHGLFEEMVWEGSGFLDWCMGWQPAVEDHMKCPKLCGLCEKHLNKTCCTIFDITNNCDLSCNFCFAESGKGANLQYEDACKAMDDILESGSGYIHISGGEPLMHQDILKIINYAKTKGFEYIQLNSNGMRISEDKELAFRLKEEGVDSVFLSFDGTEDDIYEKICGQKLLQKKIKVIENCDEARLGVVLVPRLIKGINHENIGGIVKYAYANMPAVRGVHIQPVTYTGRYIKGEHITLPEVLDFIEIQTEGLIKRNDFLPSSCDAPLCGFHAEYTKVGGELMKITSNSSCCGTENNDMKKRYDEGNSCSDCCTTSSCSLEEPRKVTLERKIKVSRSQLHVKNRWTRKSAENAPEGSLDDISKKISDSSFFVSGMMFQDLSNIDLARCRCCSLHVYDNGDFVPFCIRHNIRGC